MKNSDVPGAEKYREQLERWLDAIPDSNHQTDLRRWLASSDDMQHYTARLEIILDGLFRERGWNLIYHPPLRGVTTHPDFFVQSPSEQFICEAVLIADNETERQRERRLLEIVDGLAGISGRFRVWVRPLTPLPDTLPARKLRAFLRRELGNLDPDSISDRIAIRFEDSCAGKTIAVEFWIFASKKEMESVVNVWGRPEAREITTYERIRGSLEYKADKYGIPSIPYLIVAWVKATFQLDEFQIERALFGDQQLSFSTDPTSFLPPALSHLPNGLFTRLKDGKYANSHVSAIAFYSTALSEDGPTHTLQVYHNPSANRHLSGHLFQGYPQFVRWSSRGRLRFQ